MELSAILKSENDIKICLIVPLTMGIVPDSSSEEGNTKSSSPVKKKQISPAKRWGFVLNNYTDDDISSIVPRLEEICKFGCFSKEVGETGTPHLQGYVEFLQKCRPIGHSKLTTRIHWGDENGKPSKGSREANVDYCTKWGKQELDWKHGFPRQIKLIDPVYEWEQEILKIITTEPDDRTLHWYYGDGNIGKTSFCKYLVVKHNAIIVGGKAADMKNAIATYVNENGDYPELLIMNIPKSYDIQFCSYEGIESCKDMLFYSGKYEGKMVAGPCPHMLVFANETPDTTKMMADRWKIKHIGEGGKFINDEEDLGEIA